MNRLVKGLRILSVLFLVVLLMTGCGGEAPAEPTDVPPSPTVAPTDTPPPPTSTPEPPTDTP